MSTPGRFVAIYASTLFAFVALDAVWIGFIAIHLFKSAIGGIMQPTPLISPAVAFYLIYTIGLVLLAVRNTASAAEAALRGAVLGLTAYATFDLTNLAIIKGWTWSLAIVDIAWGTLLSAVAAATGYVAARR